LTRGAAGGKERPWFSNEDVLPWPSPPPYWSSWSAPLTLAFFMSPRRTLAPEKMEFKKFDPVARKHVVFKEQKMK
jgi:hypothetical protein